MTDTTTPTTTESTAEKVFLYPYSELKKLLGLLMGSPWHLVNPFVSTIHGLQEQNGVATLKETHDQEIAAAQARQAASNQVTATPSVATPVTASTQAETIPEAAPATEATATN